MASLMKLFTYTGVRMPIIIIRYRQGCKIIIVLTFCNQFSFETILFSIESKGFKIQIQPIKGPARNILIFHLIVNLTVIIICQIDHEASIFFLKKITQVTGIDQNPATRLKQLAQPSKKCGNIYKINSFKFCN